MVKLTHETMYSAMLKKDQSYEGLFFTCVKTTGIFCRPVCTARKPKKENVEFVHNAREALSRGYRPCKVCKPMQHYQSPSNEIRKIIDEITLDPTMRITDTELRERRLEPHSVRRWFKKNYNMTFHEFQRMLRINTAFKKIKNGTTVLETAYSTGFESVSGFADTFKSIFGISPQKSKEINIIDLKRFETPLGTMIGCATQNGICLLEFSDRRMLETQFKLITKYYNAKILQGLNPLLDQLESQLTEYFNGKIKEFTIPLDVKGTPFQKMVWEELQTIPYGETRSYREQAINLGKPNSIRAVANANGMNRIAIIIPCHRVIGSDGKMVGYGGGVWRKQWLLNFEKSNKTINN